MASEQVLKLQENLKKINAEVTRLRKEALDKKKLEERVKTLKAELKERNEKVAELRAEPKKSVSKFILKDRAQTEKTEELRVELTKTNESLSTLDKRMVEQVARLNSLISAVSAIKIDIPKEVSVKNPQESVRVTNLKDIVIPKVDLKDLKALRKDLKALGKELAPLKLGDSAENPVAVRLSDGEKFYKALEYVIQNASGGGSVPKITLDGGIQAVPVVNPDGTNVGGNSGTSDVNVDQWGGTDTTLGQKTMAASVPTVIASDQSAIPVSNAALTELAGAINASSQVDVNIVDVNTTVPVSGEIDVVSVIPTTGATALGKAEDAAHTSGHTGVMMLGVRNDSNLTLTSDNGDYAALSLTSTGALWTNGEVTVSGDVATISEGTRADDLTVPGSPVMTGGFSRNFDGTDPGNVSTEGDVARFATDPNRRQYVNTVHPQYWSYHLNTSTAQTDTAVAADPGDGYAIFVTDIVFSSGAATAINLFFEEGSTTVLGPYYLEATAGRGVALHFQTPKVITASTALTLTTSASVAHSVDVMGFVARVA